MIDTSPSFASSPGTHADNLPAFPAATTRAASCCPDDTSTTATSESGDVTVCRIDRPRALRYGGRLPHLCLAYELSGPAGAPLVAVQGGISAGRHVTATDADPSKGWWQDFVGPSKAIDTRRVRVLGFDYLGGNGDSSGPRQCADDEPFPTVSTADQAWALAALLHKLGEGPLHAYVGSSYGGMVGLAFAAEFPTRLQRLVVISAAHRNHPQATAWRSLQRSIVELGLAQGCLHESLALARGLAMTTYRTPLELAQRFDAPPRPDDQGCLRFPVEGYLEARGEAFAGSFHAQAFLGLSRSIDLHRVAPQRVTVPTHVVAVTRDQLVPIDHLRQLAGALPQGILHEIDSLYGHDAFLKETHQISDVLRGAIPVLGAECTDLGDSQS